MCRNVNTALRCRVGRMRAHTFAMPRPLLFGVVPTFARCGLLYMFYTFLSGLACLSFGASVIALLIRAFNAFGVCAVQCVGFCLAFTSSVVAVACLALRHKL